MLIANVNNTLHSFEFIPKGTDVNSIIINNILDDETFGFSKSQIFKDKYFYVLKNAEMELNVNDNLSFTVYDSNDNIIYSDFIYCVDQDIDTFNINKNVYKERVTENKFITNEQ